jgi:hypothetical protein
MVFSEKLFTLSENADGFFTSLFVTCNVQLKNDFSSNKKIIFLQEYFYK